MGKDTSVTRLCMPRKPSKGKLPRRARRSLEDRLQRMLQRLPPPERRAVISRLTQAQRERLERWMLAKQASTLDLKHCAEARLASWRSLLRCRGWPQLRGQKRRMDESRGRQRGLYHRIISGRSTYEAVCTAGPFSLCTRQTSNLELAMRYKQVLMSIRRRVEASLDDPQEGFKRAVSMELQQSGFTAKDMNLTFVTRVGARYWVGRSLETPRFSASGDGLEQGFSAWRRLRQARCVVFEGACNELSLLSQHSPGELADAWARLRSVYLDIWEEAGHRQRAARRLARLEARQAPRQQAAERRWRASCAACAETPQAVSVAQGGVAP
ncbi:unnamed protein product [Effrenium voratum]|uniref:Uncharacterized protein n=1 Tax=Effrenium voratum TaxID=2562239 RepID=A0AA36IEW5_9DINO|nr:unnamed protein product [Effrenium voratum]CAJ1449684.1 unnamed protein product [Effrenium voratum]